MTNANANAVGVEFSSGINLGPVALIQQGHSKGLA
jgi:hypothetical protein